LVDLLNHIQVYLELMNNRFNEEQESLSQQLKKRTKAFAIRIIQLYRALPKTGEARVIGNQLLKSGTSVAANYRAVCRARSKAEFTAKSA
jgi:hypothetical protein